MPYRVRSRLVARRASICARWIVSRSRHSTAIAVALAALSCPASWRRRTSSSPACRSRASAARVRASAVETRQAVGSGRRRCGGACRRRPGRRRGGCRHGPGRRRGSGPSAGLRGRPEGLDLLDLVDQLGFGQRGGVGGEGVVDEEPEQREITGREPTRVHAGGVGGSWVAVTPPIVLELMFEYQVSACSCELLSCDDGPASGCGLGVDGGAAPRLPEGGPLAVAVDVGHPVRPPVRRGVERHGGSRGSAAVSRGRLLLRPARRTGGRRRGTGSAPPRTRDSASRSGCAAAAPARRTA
jgi:hypothetical protein